MISFNFKYTRPDTLTEAVRMFDENSKEGKNALYYAGGSEIITMCRSHSIRPDVVIDIKNIPECTSINIDAEFLNLGAACTLNQIGQSNLFPLLRLACGRIADHTNQCRITLGGNLCGTILYRETSLPLLLSDAEVTLFSVKGKRRVPMKSVFQGSMQLFPGELVVQVHIPVWALSARHFHIKKTANEKIDYPLVTVAAIVKGEHLSVAFSGICRNPFQSDAVDAILNDKATPYDERVELAIAAFPEPIQGDRQGSKEYKAFVLKNTLRQLLEEWDNG